MIITRYLSRKITNITNYAKDRDHDLVILKLTTSLTPLKLGNENYVDDGTEVLLTGFPIAAVLGLYPATHIGMVAATTLDVIPTAHSSRLSIQMLDRLEKKFMIY